MRYFLQPMQTTVIFREDLRLQVRNLELSEIFQLLSGVRCILHTQDFSSARVTNDLSISCFRCY